MAAKYLLWAAPLTSRRAVADTRLLRGARLLLADGDLVLGSYAYEAGDADSAQRLLSVAATHEDADQGIRADAHVRLSSIYVMRGEPRRQAQAAEAALALDRQMTKSPVPLGVR